MITSSTRSRSIVEHFEVDHTQLLNVQIGLPSNILEPLWYPIHFCLSTPPSLLQHSSCGTILSGEVGNRPFKALYRPMPSPTAPVTLSLSLTLQKQRLHSKPTTSAHKTPSQNTPYQFGDLQPLDKKNLVWGPMYADVHALTREIGMHMDISRPHATLTQEKHVVIQYPRTILFETFLQEYEEQNQEDDEKIATHMTVTQPMATWLVWRETWATLDTSTLAFRTTVRYLLPWQVSAWNSNVEFPQPNHNDFGKSITRYLHPNNI